MKNIKKKIALALLLLLLTPIVTVNAQSLYSNSYEIVDPSIGSVTGTSNSNTDTYSLVSFVGTPISDTRLQSGTYKVGAGFPNGTLANVPVIRCFETTTDDTAGGNPNTTCLAYPLTASTGGNDAIVGDGMQGVCGTPGCYSYAKIEVDTQSNPIDTLYLVSLTNTSTGIEYFVQSDNTISTTYDIADYQTICQLEGYDARTGSGCAVSSDPQWNETLQKYNIFGLSANTAYTAKVRALHGDFTESIYGPTVSATTAVPAVSFDIDIAGTGGAASETAGPHGIAFGELSTGVQTATNRIWIDFGTNGVEGSQVRVLSNNGSVQGGLYNGSNVIPSTNEDLNFDANGGYGLKIETATETSLGPLIPATKFDTIGANEVGGLSSPTYPSGDILVYTEKSSPNIGQVSNGRVSLAVKVSTVSSTPPGAYTDSLLFSVFPSL